MSEDEQATMTAHVAYWSGLTAGGAVLAFGPIADPSGPHGVAVLLADDLSAAEALRDEDPAVLSAHGFRTEVIPFLGLVTPDGRCDAT